MAIKKPVKKDEKTTVPDSAPGGVSLFMNGPKAKWLYFAFYFLITIFIFRDFLFDSGTMLFGSDTIPDGVYTRQYYKDYHEQYGGIPKWNPLILGGLPFIDAMHGDTFYPGAWMQFFMPLTRALGHKLILHVFLAGLFMYFFLRTLKIRRDAAFLGGLMYMLAPTFVTWLYGGHDAKMYVIALLPLAFGFLEKGMSGKPAFQRYIYLGAVMGLMILTSHVQMAYYSYWAIGLYFIYKLFTGHTDGKSFTAFRSVYFIMAVVIAVMLGAVQLLPSYKFTTTQSVRSGPERTGYEYATSWSMHPEEAAGMIIPSFQGFNFYSGENTYWGRNPFKLNSEYNGIIPIIFLLLGLLMLKRKEKWFFFGLALLSLIYSLGADTPFYRLFYSLVPGVKNFRAPGMMIFILAFSSVIVASRFLSDTFDNNLKTVNKNKTLIIIIAAIFVSAVIVSAMGKGFFNIWISVLYNNFPEAKNAGLNSNLQVFFKDLWRVAILAGVSVAGIMLFVRKKIPAVALVSLIALVIVVDCVSVDKKFITTIDPNTYPALAPDENVNRIKQELAKSPMPFRILGLDVFGTKSSSNYYAMFGIQVADGHHNNELQTYERFKGGRQITNFLSLWLDNKGLVPDGIGRNNFLKVAGVKYLVLPGKDNSTQLVPNASAFDRAFVVSDYMAVENDSLAVKKLNDPSFDPSKVVLLTGKSFNYAHPDSVMAVLSVKDFKYTKDGVSFTATMGKPGFAVLSENIVPYWKAAIDGKQTVIEKAFGTFMAVYCEAGTHEIIFSLKSGPYNTGKRITFIALLIVLAVFAGYGIKGLIKK